MIVLSVLSLHTLGISEKNIMNWFEWKPKRKEVQKPDKKGEQKETAPASYLGMSTNQIIPTQRLKFYWSVLGDCIEDRIKFTFRCTDQHEANELKILTFSLVYQINDRWKVDLDGLELRAEPPAEKEGGVVKN